MKNIVEFMGNMILTKIKSFSNFKKWF